VSNDIYHYGVIVMIYCEKREFVKRSDVSDVNRIQISTLSYRNLNLNLCQQLFLVFSYYSTCMCLYLIQLQLHSESSMALMSSL